MFIGVSLDGFIARPDGDIAWLTDPPGDRGHARVGSDTPAQEWDTFFPQVDHVVMGRATYETVLGFAEWPYRDKRVIVLSSTLDEVLPAATLARDLTEVDALLREAGAAGVYVDGGRTIRAFLGADLIDELTVCVAPVLIGTGRPLFGELVGDRLLRLRASHVVDGMVHTTYDVLPAPPHDRG